MEEFLEPVVDGLGDGDLLPPPVSVLSVRHILTIEALKVFKLRVGGLVVEVVVQVGKPVKLGFKTRARRCWLQ